MYHENCASNLMATITTYNRTRIWIVKPGCAAEAGTRFDSPTTKYLPTPSWLPSRLPGTWVWNTHLRNVRAGFRVSPIDNGFRRIGIREMLQEWIVFYLRNPPPRQGSTPPASGRGGFYSIITQVKLHSLLKRVRGLRRRQSHLQHVLCTQSQRGQGHARA